MTDELLNKLIEMKDSEVRKLDVAHSDYEKKVRTIKHIIDQRLDIKNNFTVHFNSLFTKIVKYNLAKWI